jgi:uncharacterized repeat protein (TIGR01451 family)
MRKTGLTLTTLVVALTTAAVLLRADLPGQTFDGLPLEYGQQLFAATYYVNNYLGGLVVLQNGDVLAAECTNTPTTILHRFSGTETTPVYGTDLHDETAVISTAGGCGIAYHPDGFVYSNMWDGRIKFKPAKNGIARIDLSGGPTKVMGPPGNALGIAVGAVSSHLFYPGEGCRSVLAPTTSCKIIELTTAGDVVKQFELPATMKFIDGIALDAAERYIFLTRRIAVASGELVVLRRDGTLVQQVPILKEPIGLGFHTNPDFVVTTNVDGTITRFDFPGGDYEAGPSFSDFAYYGFRADLAQAGPDGCLYVSQGGTRYNDGTQDDEENSIVRICEGFVPPPGITLNPPPPPSSLCGFVYNDANNDGLRASAGEPGIAGVTVQLTGSDQLARPVTRSTSTDGTGSYCFSDLKSGTYTIVEVQTSVSPITYLDGKDTPGSPAAANVSKNTFSNIQLGEGISARDYNFGEVLPSTLCGYAYVDGNDNGIREAGEVGLPGVTVTLTGSEDFGGTVTLVMATDTQGRYCFDVLLPGRYTVQETQPSAYGDGKDTQGTPGTAGSVGNDVFNNIRLSQNVQGDNNNFGELPLNSDVRLALSGLPSSVTSGTQLSYTLTATNAGPATAENVVLTTEVPANMTLSSIEPPAGWTCTAPAAGDTGTISCRTATMPVDQTAVLNVTALVKCVYPSPGMATVAGRISSSTPDPNVSNDSVTGSTMMVYPVVTLTNASVTTPTAWPPNHKMFDTDVRYTVGGGCGSTPKVSLSVASNEPTDGTDWRIVDADSVQLRSERRGSGSGRIYTITVTAADAYGSSAQASLQVVVPHDMGDSK